MTRLLAAAVAGLLLIIGLTVPAAAADVSPEAEIGFQQISQCLQSRDDLAVLLVVDESGSLQETDPNDTRAKFLANLVRSLGRQAGQPTADGARQIDLAVSTYSTDYRPLVPWTEMTPSSAESVASDLEQQIPTLDEGGGTNHPEALAGARNQLAEHAAQAQQPPCQVAILFTDGVLYVSDEPSENVAAAQDMCRPGGVVDGMRRDGINLVTVMLYDEATAQETASDYEQGRDLLKATAEGNGGTSTCGTVPIPPEYARGAYLEGGVDRLASLFASAFALSQGATLVTREGSPAIVMIDPGVASFAVIGLAPQGISLQNPSGITFAIAKDAPGDQAVDAVWDFDNVTAQVTVGDGDQGEWTITRPGQSDELSVFLNTGLGIKLGDVALLSGEEARIDGSIVRPGSDEPVDLSVYRDYKITAAVTGATAEPLTLNPDGTFIGSVTPEGDGTTAEFDITLDLTTDSGQELQPVSGRFTRSVALPKEFPSVAPASLALSPLVGRRGEATGQLTVIGSQEGPTTFCVNPVTWTATDDPNRYDTEQTTGCFDLAASEQRTVDVAVSADSPTDERVSGTMPLTLTSAKGTERAITVPVDFVATRPLNQAVRLGVVAVLALLALLIPLSLLYLVNRRLARFSPADGTRSGAMPAAVSRSGIKSREGAVTSLSGSGPRGDLGDVQPAASRFDIPADKLRVMAAPEKKPRRISGPDGSILQTRAPRSVVGTPSARVSAGPGMRVYSNQQPFILDGGHAAPISMGLGGVWYVTVSDADLVGDPEKPISATVSAFVPPVGGGDKLVDVINKIRSFAHYESILTQLRAAALAEQPTQPPPRDQRPGGGPLPPKGGGPRPPSGPSGPRGPVGPSGSAAPAGPSGPVAPATSPASSPRGPSSPPAGSRSPGEPGRTGATNPNGPTGPAARPSPGTGTESGPSGPWTGPRGPSGPGGR